MDQITFHYDTVLSDVHLLLPNSRHLMARLNRVGQPVFISRFRILWDGTKQRTCDLGSPGGGEELDRDTQEESGRGDARGSETGADGGVDRDEDRGADGGVNRDEDGGVDRDEDGGADGGVDRDEDGGVDRDEDRGVEPPLDEDGDLEVPRRPRQRLPERDRDMVYPIILSQARRDEEEEDEEEECPRDVIRIEHTMATPLEDVGKQVWRGAFLLADLILSQPTTFRGATVLELGAGTGLTSVVMATVAKTVYCTDVGEDLLSMCQKNVTLNRHLMEPAGGKVRVRLLDWLRHDLCTDADAEFGWTEDEVADLHDNTTIIIAADVCYDDDLTDALFRTLYRICNNLRLPCTTYLSIEKRLNFTLRHMDISCEAYDHFRHCLCEMQELRDGRTCFTVEQVTPSFPQCLLYERIEQLELWKVTAVPV
ncbi:methyltransferase-like protein 22 [Oncorhynchus tshawytscha]|uniref:Methyltransferase-like protein 22 n=2 Tax=Oncorhynchus TaxID=8016 RepID=A0AAZ3P924_ONCTS|nr:methyltransferase-like protein 22 [Oncorhynchus tshawytscha]XP_042171433.1 methyltransferase-like protein 22 [Oncorhynchus tshawytscha]